MKTVIFTLKNQNFNDMLDELFEYLVGIIFGLFLLTILILFLACFVFCSPVSRNKATTNQIPQVLDEQEETILWFDSICSNDPIRLSIQKKISHFIQTKISYFLLSPDCQSILQNISVLSTKIPTITSSRVKSIVKDDHSLVTIISINLDSPIIITTSSFVNSLNKEVISDISVTQINPNINIVIPYQKGDINVDIDLGVDAEVDVNSTEPIGAGEDVLKGMFIKIMRNLDIKFGDDDDDIFNDNNNNNNAIENNFDNINNEDIVEEEEEDEDFDNETGELYDASCQTINRGKIELSIPSHPSVSITAVNSFADSLYERITTPQKKIIDKSTFSEHKDHVDIKPDENILELIQKNKNKKDEVEKAKLSIAKSRSSCFEVKLKKPNKKSFYSEEVFDVIPEEPKIEEEEQESDNDDDEETITSSVKVSKRSFTIQ